MQLHVMGAHPGRTVPAEPFPDDGGPVDASFDVTNRSFVEPYVVQESYINPPNLVRVVNRVRENNRQHHPMDLDFELSFPHIGGDFLRDDVRIDGERHLLFCTRRQLETLVQARTWYMDATFRVVRAPFHQLLSIHAFIRCLGELKQVQLVFAVMSRRRTKDYVAVCRALLAILPSQPLVQEFVMDFELAIWTSVRRVFPTVRLQGCSFQWSQAVWRRCMELGIQKQYMTSNSVYKFIRKLLFLPYLPTEHIRPSFTSLEASVPDGARSLKRLYRYIGNTWIQSNTFPVASWCVFGRSTRTNNDTEGWHSRLNRKARGQGLHLYLLIRLLQDEARYLPMQLQLVTEGKLRQYQRTKARSNQGQLFQLWDRYRARNLPASQLV